MTDDSIYNPLDKVNLGKSVADALLAREPQQLGEIESFKGAGIYVIYYVGKFKPYSSISTANANGHFDSPIYVGKAIPPGGRKGKSVLGRSTSTALFRRLKEHAESIQQVGNLDLSHFYCRYLVVDDIWIPLGEALLIARFSPIWNHFIDGFGNHDPGKGRYQQVQSRWDVLHPGRSWAGKCRERSESQKHIINDLTQHLRS